MWWLALLAALLAAGAALAQSPADRQGMTPEKQLDYIGILYQDRAQLELQHDRDRLEREDLERELAAARQKVRDVDDYWKRWTGVN